MRAIASARSPHGECVVDLCSSCHALWFDAFESVRLTPGAIIDLFREVAHAEAPARQALPASLRCPRCRATLAETRDLQRTTRFSYWRCPKGHGRFTPFVQFLREKDFIRPLSGAELARLRAHIRSVRCSGCGAAVDLGRNMACGYCRAPVEVLDPDAIATALAKFEAAEAKRGRIDPSGLADALLARRRPILGERPIGGLDVSALPDAGVDLIAAGLAVLAGAFAADGT